MINYSYIAEELEACLDYVNELPMMDDDELEYNLESLEEDVEQVLSNIHKVLEIVRGR